jgi:hypothetical protein
MSRRTREDEAAPEPVGIEAQEPSDIGVAPAVPDCVQVRKLLGSYQALLDETSRMRRNAPLSRWMCARTTERLVVERVRRALALLNQRYQVNKALSDNADVATGDCHQRVADLAASLRAAPSRFQVVWLVAVILVIGRIGLALLELALPSPSPHLSSPTAAAVPFFPSGNTLSHLSVETQRLSNLNATNVGQVADVVFTTDILVTCIVLMILGFAAWIVLRPLGSGAAAARILFGGSSDGDRGSSDTSERLGTLRLRIHDREREVFSASGMETPSDSRLDIIAKALLAGSVLLLAFVLWHTYLRGAVLGSDDNYGSDTHGTAFTRDARYDGYAWAAGFLAVVAVLRLGWLAGQVRGRHAGYRAGVSTIRRRLPLGHILGIALLGVVAVVFAIDAIPDRKAPSVFVVRPWDAAPDFRRGAIPLRYACDEPCTIRAARLLEGNEDLAKPWPAKADPPQRLIDQKDPNRVAVRDLIRRDVGDAYRFVSGQGRMAIWRPQQSASPLERHRWLRVWRQKGGLVAEVRVSDRAGNATTVPLDLQWGSS